MTRVTTSTFKAWIVASLACAACLVGVYATTAASAAGATSGHVATESEQVLKQQIAAGEITSASFRIKDHSLRLVLKDGEHVAVHLSGPPSAKLRAELKKSGAKVSKKSPPHKLRYIVGGVVVVVIVLAAGALLLWRRRRHAARDEY